MASCRLVVARRASVAGLAVAARCSGCGSQARNAAPAASTVAAAFKGSPPPLASLHAQANQLLGGRRGGVPARGWRALRGYPVVVNKWASWCGPCQSEFPAYQKVAVAYGRKVAFIGLNGKDQELRPPPLSCASFPVTYPSYVDPNGDDRARRSTPSTYYPQTVFFDRNGKTSSTTRPVHT